MVCCHLSILMTWRRLRASDVARLTQPNRSTITALVRQTATRIDLPAVEKLCTVLQCSVGDLFEVVPEVALDRTAGNPPGTQP